MAVTINGSTNTIDLGSNGTITNLAVGGVPDGTIDTDALAANAVTDAKSNITQYSDADIRKDLLTLALQTAVDTNRKAYNLQNSFIDQFEDDTGLGTETNVDRTASGEYISSIQVEVVGGDNDTYSKALQHCETERTNEITGGPGFLEVGNTNANTNQNKFGSKSWQFDGSNDWMKCVADSSGKAWEPEGGDFTLDFWFYPTTSTRSALYAGETDYWFGLDYHHNGTRNVNLWASHDGSDWNILHGDSGSGSGTGTISLTLNSWNHIAAVRSGNNWMTFINGVKDIDQTNSNSVVDESSEFKRIGEWGNGGMDVTGHIDEFHWRKGKATWTSNFTPPTQAYPWNITTASATGTLASNKLNSDSVSRTKVSGVILYKNDAGAANIGTDLKVSFTCNGGTNWTEVTDRTVGSDFSTGVKTLYLNETTCTAGTDVRYKIEWANQSEGSLVTQVHGIGVNW